MASLGTMLPAPPRPTLYTGAWWLWNNRSRSSSSSKLNTVRSLEECTFPAPPRPPKKRPEEVEEEAMDGVRVVGGATRGVEERR